MIEVQGLTKFYGQRKVLHEISFSVHKGFVCGFLGPNGSGKSTTMDILAGLLGPSGGQAKICGYDVVTQTRDVKAHVGYLPDSPPLYKDMTVRDFLAFVAKLRGIFVSTMAVHRVIEACDVGEVADRLIGHLSKGFRQRVALCAALIHEPPVLILDEPTEGLDPNQILHIRNLIKKTCSEKTVILSSHILPEVEATCQEAVIINHGKIASTTTLINSKLTKYKYVFAEAPKSAFDWFRNQDFIIDLKMQQDDNSVTVEFKPESINSNTASLLAKINQNLSEIKMPPATIQKCASDIEALFFNAINADVQASPEEESLA